MIPRGIPDGIDPETSRRILRSVLVVRMVRGGLLLVFLVVAAVAVEAQGWPRAATAVVGLAALVQAAALVGWGRRYRAAGDTAGAVGGHA